MASGLDKAKAVRKGEQLNEEKLLRYLNQSLGKEEPSLEVKQFPSGFSNLTYLIQYDKEEYVLRRPPFGANVKSGHDMGREYNILKALEGQYTKAPKPVLFCENLEILEAPFYLMRLKN